MKKKIIMRTCMLIVLTLGLSGCGNSTATKAIEQGKLSLANLEYDKALGAFELAINEGIKDKEIKKLVKIIEGYNNSKSLIDEGKIEEAKSILDIIHEDYKSYAIKDDIDSLKKAVKEYDENNEFMIENLEVIERLIIESKYVDAKAKVDEISNNNEIILEPYKERFDMQVKTIDSELAKIEEAKALEEKKKQGISKEQARKILVNKFASSQTGTPDKYVYSSGGGYASNDKYVLDNYYIFEVHSYYSYDDGDGNIVTEHNILDSNYCVDKKTGNFREYAPGIGFID